jgi:hypothetical protein
MAARSCIVRSSGDAAVHVIAPAAAPDPAPRDAETKEPAMSRLPLRFWIEVALGAASAVATALATVWPDWIERAFGFAPDDGDGAVEWGWAIALAVATLALFVDAGRVWRARAGAAAK